MREWFSSFGWPLKALLAMMFVCVLFPFSAFAQVDPVTLQDPMAVAQIVWEAVTTKGPNVVYFVVVGALVVSVSLFRKYGKSLSAKFLPKAAPKIATFLDNPLVAYFLPVVFSIAAAMLTAMKAGHPFWPDAAKAGFSVAVSAVWAFIGFKKVQEVRTLAKAKATNDVQTTTDVLKVL